MGNINFHFWSQIFDSFFGFPQSIELKDKVVTRAYIFIDPIIIYKPLVAEM